jgi:hypothetical protein
MNEHDQPIQPPIIGTALGPPPAPTRPKPISWWLRKLFACNPFYPVSAALLLYGCYRVSVDAPIFNLETARLLFNFTAVQLYEVLLVITAIYLARRALWYDATLLAGLENLLVFVPFIFISLAALIDARLALTMCLAGGAVAILRFGSLKRWFTQLRLPNALLVIGFILLTLNIVLPLVYRAYGEHIIGAFINSGPAHAMNVRVWMLVLPAAFALANLLPRLPVAGALPPQRRWLPLGWFSLWMTVTCLHLYSLGYVYQFDFRSEQVAPALWVLAWTVCFQLNRNLPQLKQGIKYALALPPLLVPLFAVAPENGNRTFLILTALNLAVYGGLRFYDRNHRLAGHLLYASILMLVAGLPEAWLQFVLTGLTGGRAVAFGLVAYLLFWTLRLRDPKLAVLGSLVLGCAVASLLRHHANALHWAFQSGFVFMLVHSLRWNDAKHPGAKVVRILTAVAWVAESFFWMNSAEARFWMPWLSSATVLTGYIATRTHLRPGAHLVVPATSILVMLSGPANATADGMLTLPVGLLAVCGSFLLFGLGTVAALTRHHWQKHEHRPGIEAPNLSRLEG